MECETVLYLAIEHQYRLTMELYKILYIAWITVLLTVTSAFAELTWYGQSKPTNGLYVVVTGSKDVEGTNWENKISESIVYHYRSIYPTNVGLYFPSNPAYRCAVDMVDSHNRSVSKTSTGASYGAKYDRNIKFNDVRLGGAHIFAGEYNPQEVMAGLDLPSPDKLFKMKKPGTYKMTFQFQVFSRVGTNSPTLVKLPPVEIAVKKDEE
jgi:hypothetical protein